jgi:hypothetical protein
MWYRWLRIEDQYERQNIQYGVGYFGSQWWRAERFYCDLLEVDYPHACPVYTRALQSFYTRHHTDKYAFSRWLYGCDCDIPF